MARKDALLRLHERLTSKRDALRKKLLREFERSQDSDVGLERGGDVCDAALDGESDELNTHIAELESRELKQIERAIQQIRTGRYGQCEMCDKAIPIERLKALPFTSLCINCQRVYEQEGGSSEMFEANWESAYEMEGRMSEKEFTIGDIDVRD